MNHVGILSAWVFLRFFLSKFSLFIDVLPPIFYACARTNDTSLIFGYSSTIPNIDYRTDRHYNTQQHDTCTNIREFAFCFLPFYSEQLRALHGKMKMGRHTERSVFDILAWAFLGNVEYPLLLF
jgi:hypothetical protein